MGLLIDTNILAELRKGSRGDVGVLRWFDGVGEDEIYLSVITLGEIRRGVELLKRKDPQGADILLKWLESLPAAVGARILPITREIADMWGSLGVPDPLPVADGLIAATALAHDLTLVTRDTKDMARTGARLLNPFATGKTA